MIKKIHKKYLLASVIDKKVLKKKYTLACINDKKCH